MSYSIKATHDLRIAVVIGVVMESVLALRAFELGSELSGRHPWLQISQMPGAQISERIFRHSGVPEALVFAILFQITVFTVSALGIIYLYRLIRCQR